MCASEKAADNRPVLLAQIGDRGAMRARIGAERYEPNVAVAGCGQSPAENHPFVVTAQHPFDQDRRIIGRSSSIIASVTVCQRPDVDQCAPLNGGDLSSVTRDKMHDARHLSTHWSRSG